MNQFGPLSPMAHYPRASGAFVAGGPGFPANIAIPQDAASLASYGGLSLNTFNTGNTGGPANAYDNPTFNTFFAAVFPPDEAKTVFDLMAKKGDPAKWVAEGAKWIGIWNKSYKLRNDSAIDQEEILAERRSYKEAIKILSNFISVAEKNWAQDIIRLTEQRRVAKVMLEEGLPAFGNDVDFMTQCMTGFRGQYQEDHLTKHHVLFCLNTLTILQVGTVTPAAIAQVFSLDPGRIDALKKPALCGFLGALAEKGFSGVFKERFDLYAKARVVGRAFSKDRIYSGDRYNLPSLRGYTKLLLHGVDGSKCEGLFTMKRSSDDSPWTSMSDSIDARLASSPEDTAEDVVEPVPFEPGAEATTILTALYTKAEGMWDNFVASEKPSKETALGKVDEWRKIAFGAVGAFLADPKQHPAGLPDKTVIDASMVFVAGLVEAKVAKIRESFSATSNDPVAVVPSNDDSAAKQNDMNISL